MRIQIHKNYFKKYWNQGKWCNVPEFLTFQTLADGTIAFSLEEDEEIEDNKLVIKKEECI
jgi:hypothetical protein